MSLGLRWVEAADITQAGGLAADDRETPGPLELAANVADQGAAQPRRGFFAQAGSAYLAARMACLTLLDGGIDRPDAPLQRLACALLDDKEGAHVVAPQRAMSSRRGVVLAQVHGDADEGDSQRVIGSAGAWSRKVWAMADTNKVLSSPPSWRASSTLCCRERQTCRGRCHQRSGATAPSMDGAYRGSTPCRARQCQACSASGPSRSMSRRTQKASSNIWLISGPWGRMRWG